MPLVIHAAPCRVGQTDIRRWRLSLDNPAPSPEAFRGFRAQVGSFMPQGARALVFRSDWGREMTPRLEKAAGLTLAVRSGRSCHGAAPYAFLREEGGAWQWYAVCWPGNWRLTFTKEGRVEFAMDEDMLFGTLEPGESLPLPEVIAARCEGGKDSLCRDVRAYLRRTLPPTRARADEVTWNHWWRYEDAEITEDIVLCNARVAAQMGFTRIVLDAGWFGDPTAQAHWTCQRGDWDKVNGQRFPHGLSWLAEEIRGLGLKFGLWMEPEGMGADSGLRREHPRWEAMRDGAPLPEPYLCLGAEGAAEHLWQHMAGLIRLTKADWVKLDFNVNPGLGCNRADHGHAPGLGLYRHMQAYWTLVDRLRAEFPRLVVENCSSGGMRGDLFSLAHTDVTFLSDPDETAHSLQVFLNLSFLPPERLYHWAWSETRLYPEGSRVFPTLPPDASAGRLGSAMAGAMLHPLGLSRDLTALTGAQRDFLAGQIAFFRREIAPMIPRSRLRLLTPPPLRRGERSQDDGRSVPWTGTSAACLMEDGRRAFLLIYGRPEGSLALPGVWAEAAGLRCVADGEVQPWQGRAPRLPQDAEAALYELILPKEE